MGPNGAGKTTTLSMTTGLLRPDAGSALIHGVDVWARPVEAKRLIATSPTVCACSTDSPASSS